MITYAGSQHLITFLLFLQVANARQFIGQNLQHRFAKERKGSKQTDKGHIHHGEHKGSGYLQYIEYLIGRSALHVQQGQSNAKGMHCGHGNRKLLVKSHPFKPNTLTALLAKQGKD